MKVLIHVTHEFCCSLVKQYLLYTLSVYKRSGEPYSTSDVRLSNTNSLKLHIHSFPCLKL